MGSSSAPKSLSASLRFTTTTRALAASSRWLKDRPGHTSPPATWGQSASRPEMFTCRHLFPGELDVSRPVLVQHDEPDRRQLFQARRFGDRDRRASPPGVRVVGVLLLGAAP